MTTNSTDHPNVIQVCGDSTYSYHFGPLLAVTPMTIGPRSWVNLLFRRGVHLGLSPEAAIALADRLPAALLGFPTLLNPGDYE